MRRLVRALWLSCLLAATVHAQAPAQAPAQARPRASRAPASPVEVDRDGVLRWTASGQEVALFGVNYAAPFAYDHRAIARMGLDPKRAIDADVAHLARLGIDAYRIHVWDREVSDRAGNLLVNEHIDLLDYLLSRLAARGIKTILTPIGWWGPGYPEPDLPSPGFSNDHSKQRMAVDTAARRAQVRYLAQFIAHVNPYTGRSYRDDPDVIAIEIFNEPWHDLGTPAGTTRYINALVGSLRGAGLRKPIFYNISEHWTAAHGAAVCAADIQGVSAQWYPTGLVRGAALPGNMLPNVDRYPVPWDGFAGCADKARMVYEFDGADVTQPVMYPAMARAFRGAGFQWATQFAYDPLALAHANTEYQTHYLNLVHTPAKAISFLIAGEAFRRLPRGFDAGTYPASERFGAFRTSYADGLSELASDTVFANAGSTRTAPPAPAALRHVAGVGSSPVVAYLGTGAYFLDRLADGIWRLEVYPDAVPVEDPHTRGSLRRTVTRVYWRTHDMRVTLPDLGAGFSAEPLDPGNAHRPRVSGNAVPVRPGVYLLARAGASREGFTATSRVGGRTLGEFFAPPSSEGPTVVRHEPPASVVAGSSFDVSIDVVQASPPDSVLAFVRQSGWQGYRRPIRLEATGAYTYGTRIATDTGHTGPLEYVLTLFEGGKAVTYPGGGEGVPTAWDYAGASRWSTLVEPVGAGLVLFSADHDRSRVVDPGWVDGVRPSSMLVAGSAPERLAWLAGADAFGPTASHLAFRTMLREPMRASMRARLADAGVGATLRVRARAESAAQVPLEIALILADGSAWGATVRAGAAWGEIDIPVASLVRVPLVLLPRPYPGFLPYELTAATRSITPDLGALEGVQWGFRRAAGTRDDEAMRVQIEWVRLTLPFPPR